MIDVSSTDRVIQVDALAYESLDTGSVSTSVGALGSLKNQTLKEKQISEGEDVSCIRDHASTKKISLDGSLGSSDAHDPDVGTLNKESSLSLLTNNQTPSNTNGSSRDPDVGTLNKESSLSLLMNNQTSSNTNGSSGNTRRYPTRGSMLCAKKSKCNEQEVITSKTSRQELSTSKNEVSKRITRTKKNFTYCFTNNGTADDGQPAKANTSLKRKLCSHEKQNSHPPTHGILSDDDIASWIRGTKFENLCIVENDLDNETVAHEKIKDILQFFQFVSRKLVEEQEAGLLRLGKGGRADLLTLSFLKNRFECLNKCRKYLGSVPGIEVGDTFEYRAELLLVGLHRNLQAGIGCINHGENIVAASIVSSGGYDNAVDSSNILIYSGAGGHPGYKLKKEKLSADQKLEGGNLALKNSIEARTPVRVIYGLKEDESSNNRVAKSKKIAAYVYDGLYLVEKYWMESGSNGSTLKFQLRRVPGQLEIGIKEVAKSHFSQMRRGVCIEDISDRKEKIPILVVNTIDRELPKPFTYVTKMIYPQQHKLAPPRGCHCKDGCSDSVKCACVVKNGGEIPFNREGAILNAKPLVYECGPSCNCPPSCQNRVSQHGIKFRLEVFKTKSMGWGVRSPSRIPSGSFICEYIGEMLKDSDADIRENDEYLFDIGHNYHDESLWEGLSYVPSLQKRRSGDTMYEEYTIDAANFANIGRFINHGCTPNLYAQNILYDHEEQGMPHVMLFATEDIPPFEELTYHYNYYIDRVQDPDGKIKKKDCYCGSIECTGRLY